MSEGVLYNPSPIQVQFHTCQANEILFGGSAGPGKSMALLMDPIQTQLAFEHKRWRDGGCTRPSIGWAIHFRREFPRLEHTIERSQRMFRAIDPGAHWDGTKHLWTFSCGYRFQFGHMKYEDDKFSYMSSEYSHLAWDELPEFSQGQYEFVNTRLRSSDRELQKRLRIVAAANPTGNWVRERFVDPCKDGNTLLVTTIRLSDGTVVKRSRIYIPAKLKDNPDVEFRRRYEEELRDKPAHIRLALLESDWYSVAGAFFAEEFDPAVHVCQPFRIPSGWFRFRSLDWGYKSPGSVGYYAVDRDGNLIKYRELTFQRKTVDQVAEMMQQVEDAAGEWDHGRRCSRLNGPADNQIWEKRGTIGPTIQETFAQYGIFWKKATKNRRAATAELIERLRQRGENQVPGIRFFNTCKNTIRTLPSRMTDPTDPEVPEDGGEDHWLDETFYACMSRPVVPKHDHLPHSREWYDDFEKSSMNRAPRNPRGGWHTGYGN